jgi:release factor glutamine methyltransferase
LPEVSSSASVGIRDALREAATTLAQAGCDTPRLDAELLLAAALGVDRSRLLVDDHLVVPAGFEALVMRRAAREPVAYITGFKAFRRLEVAVDPRVLIPRPETELLVEAGLRLPAGARVADVGCGSGAVALALKDERPDLSVVGIDLSPDAVTVARDNGVRLGIDAEFVRGDLLDGRAYDAVLANLPYVADGADLAPEIALYEPAAALFAGPDGLDLIRRLVSICAGVPFLALEVGFDQANAVAGLLRGAGFGSVSRLCDLAGFERVIVGHR